MFLRVGKVQGAVEESCSYFDLPWKFGAIFPRVGRKCGCDE